MRERVRDTKGERERARESERGRERASARTHAHPLDLSHACVYVGAAVAEKQNDAYLST